MVAADVQLCYYQSDLCDLKPEEVDWKAGTYHPQTVKEKDEENVPEVCYLLWPETFQALKEWGSQAGERVFTDGRQAADTGAIRYRGEGVRQTAGETGRDDVKLKQIRKTTTNILNGKIDYGAYVRYYGGWAPMGVADNRTWFRRQPVMDEMSEVPAAAVVGFEHDAPPKLPR